MGRPIQAIKPKHAVIPVSVQVGAALGGPTNTVAPVVTHPEPFLLGDLLTCDTGTFTSLGTIYLYTYQWRANGININLATSNTYEPQESDDDTVVFDCIVRAWDEFGSKAKLSNAAGPFDLVSEPVSAGNWVDENNNEWLDENNNPWTY